MTYEAGSLNVLENCVVQWAKDRNILDGSNAIDQLSKTLEECGELLNALNTMERFDPEKDPNINDVDDMIDKYKDLEEDIMDAYGDILVTLIIGMHQSRLNMDRCLAHAYDQIKDRKGKMINGLFVKEA